MNVTRDVTVAVLGIIPVGLQGRAELYLLNVPFTSALKCITIKWMQLEPPFYNPWVQKVREMEKITHLLRLQSVTFGLRWGIVRELLV